MKIAVAGTGYVGLVTGVCLAHKGHDVTCVDIDPEKIDLMKAGQSPIYEDGLESLMQAHQDRLTYTTDAKSAYAQADVIFIGVGTPEKSDGSANLNYVYQVAEEIAESLVKDTVVVVKSTVPIGTNQKVEQMIRSRCRAGIQVDVVSNPEFLSQGTAVRDTLNATRIVIGTESEQAKEIMLKLYEGFDAPIVIADRNSAEMVKYASNDFLAVKISYINEIATLCELVGADVSKVAEGMGFDPRIGPHFLRAGIGYGGSCFPKDTKALHWLSSMNDYELKTVKAAIEVNEMQKVKLIKRLRKQVPNLMGKKVAVLGLTFKPGTDDLREAPSLVNVPLLIEEGASVYVFDPIVRASFENELKRQGVTGLEQLYFSDSIQDALRDAEACLIMTEWADIKELSAADFLNEMKIPLVLDGRNCYDPATMRAAGVDYQPIGYGL